MRVELNKVKGEQWIQKVLSKSAQVYPKAKATFCRLKERENLILSSLKIIKMIIIFKIYQLVQIFKSYAQIIQNLKSDFKAKCNENGAMAPWQIVKLLLF